MKRTLAGMSNAYYNKTEVRDLNRVVEYKGYLYLLPFISLRPHTHTHSRTRTHSDVISLIAQEQ